MPLNRTRLHFNMEYEQQMLSLKPYLLSQIGDLQCEPGYLIAPHQQWVDEISLVLDGKATFEADGKAYEVGRDMIFLSGRNEVHAIRSSQLNPMRMLYLGFDFDSGCAGEAAAMRQFFDKPQKRVASSVPNVQRAFMHLISEIMRGDQQSPLLMQAYMNEIVCTVYRVFHDERDSRFLIGDASAANDKLVHDVILYLETRSDYSLRLQELSEVFGYSYAHISKVFSARTGQNLKAYYTQRRFAQARSDMQSGMSVTQTAERMGYKSIHAFSKAFKQHEGMTASEFRKCIMEHQAQNRKKTEEVFEEWRHTP